MACRISRVFLNRAFNTSQRNCAVRYATLNCKSNFTLTKAVISPININLPKFYSTNPVKQDTSEELLKASKLGREGKHDQALSLYETYLQKNPTSTAVHLNKALSLFNLKRYQEALTACEDASKVNLREFGVPGFVIYGNAYLGLDKLEEALEAFSEGLKLDPKSVILLFNRGIVLEKLKRYESSMNSFIQVLENDPKNVEACLRVSNLNLLRKQGRAALNYANKAIDIEPQNTLAQLYKGHAFVIMQLFENSLVAYDVVIDFLSQKLTQNTIEGPGDIENLLDAYLGKANAYAFMNRYGESIHFYDKALKADPNNLKALVSKAYTLYQYMGRHHEALDVVEQILAKDAKHEFATILKKAILSKIPHAEDPIPTK